MNQITWTFSDLTEPRVWVGNCVVEAGVVDKGVDDLGPFVEGAVRTLLISSEDFVVAEVTVVVDPVVCALVVVVGVSKVTLHESLLYDFRLPTLAQFLGDPLDQLHSQCRVGGVLHGAKLRLLTVSIVFLGI